LLTDSCRQHYGVCVSVHTDPGKVWKHLEINIEIFKTLNALKMIIGMEKSGKILENCNTDLENADVYYTVDYPMHLLIFLQFMTQSI